MGCHTRPLEQTLDLSFLHSMLCEHTSKHRAMGYTVCKKLVCNKELSNKHTGRQSHRRKSSYKRVDLLVSLHHVDLCKVG